ncbi:MAG: hypothetical protein IAE97_00095 [Chthoniobacterales bacterium]|nr:hypothetical protein [Chthoniobacterales bacterium]
MKRILVLLLLLPVTVHAWSGFAETQSGSLENVILAAMIVVVAALVPVLAIGGFAQLGFWALAQPFLSVTCALLVGKAFHQANSGWIKPVGFGIGVYALLTLVTNFIGLRFLHG